MLISLSKIHRNVRVIKKKRLYGFSIHETTREKEELEWKQGRICEKDDQHAKLRWGECFELEFKKSEFNLPAGNYLGFIFSDSPELQVNSSIQYVTSAH